MWTGIVLAYQVLEEWSVPGERDLSSTSPPPSVYYNISSCGGDNDTFIRDCVSVSSEHALPYRLRCRPSV